jgi:hypothetical protein
MGARLKACLGVLVLSPVAAAAAVPAPATLTSGFPVRTSAVGASGVRLDTGIKASCTHSGSACRGRVRVTSAGATLGARLIEVHSGTTTRISLLLNHRGAATLRRHGVKASIAVTLTGSDGHQVGLVRRTTLPRAR